MLKRRRYRAWLQFIAGRACGMSVDLAMIAAAYCSAILLRFDFNAPRWGWRPVAVSFITVAVVHMFALAVCGCNSLSWRRTRMKDLPRYLAAAAAACAALTALRYFTPFESYANIRPPYSVTLISFVLVSLALTGWRIVWSWYWEAHFSDDMLLSRGERRMGSAAEFLKGKTVMITGAGGSIGSELVRQAAEASPKLILMVERGENALYEIDREIRQDHPGVEVRSLMIDINNLERIEAVFAGHRPEIVLHAAAYKHVPMVEMNPEEGWRNNTEATKKLAALSSEFAVKRFVLISTDKAVNPVSVMGKTKRAAELAIMAMNAQGSPTSFCAVRFGNVLGSSGSVVPLFREQIAKRLPLTVTHPEMRRYFMTVTEAVGLVLQAASRSEKAIYTLDMGESVLILDLAEEMIRQAGYRPYVDIPIVFTGIRPGEKLFEELDISEKSAYKTDMARIYITKT
jgi:FlaA1/EpsC-like NDP-sugar epimerase